jgi:hypothetical protein
VIVPSQAGGGADIVARTIGQKLTEVLGQQREKGSSLALTYANARLDPFTCDREIKAARSRANGTLSFGIRRNDTQRN